MGCPELTIRNFFKLQKVSSASTAYYTSGTGKKGKVYTQTNANSNTTTFDYSSTTGRRTKVTNALSKDTEYTYNSRGQVTLVTGDATYPIGYVYDSYGQMSELHTYRDGLTPDKTIWTYDPATGLLTSKTDAAGKSTTYTYDSANRLATRTWARLSGGSVLVTTYSYNANTGELTSVDYSDTTPDIAYTYTRLGQQATVTDAVGTRIFAYNDALQPLTETITGLYNKTITRSYSNTGFKGRYSGVNISTEYDVDYGYDTLGRFSTVTHHRVPQGGSDDVYTYNYLANSNLVSGITYPNNISVTNAYESNRDLIDYVENKHNTTTISKYDYTNDALGRRTAMEKSGTAFTASDTITYGYNDRSEVTSADATNDANYNFGFEYDTIGNREGYTTSESGIPVTSVYEANNLNQYTNITNPTQNPTYDDDGCMLTNGDWTYTWNAENRKISAEKSDQRLEFVYDYKGRRVEKKVYSGSTGNWTLDKHLRFVYDSYQQIEELDALNSNAVAKKRIHGNGKIICEIQGSTPYYTLGDANKNRTEYLDSTGVIKAHYEYSPFGKITVANGDMADDFDYRFSSEYYDLETNTVYFNFRDYDVDLGRWQREDPIEEEGGYNLYSMLNNQVLNKRDRLGWAEQEWFDYTTPGGTENASTDIAGQGLKLKITYDEMQSEEDDTCTPPECTRYKQSCTGKASIKGKVVVTMPVLHNGDELSDRYMKAWNAWIAALQEHENRHVQDYEDFLKQKTTLTGYVEGCDPSGLKEACGNIVAILAATWYNGLVVDLAVKTQSQHLQHGMAPNTPYEMLD